MKSLRLEYPQPFHEEAAMAYRQKHLERGEEMHGSARLEQFDKYTDWLAYTTRNRAESTCTPGLVPATTLFALAGDEVVGMIDIRHRLNDFLLSYGGHIGYGISPDRRGAGLGTAMLALALPYAKKEGIDRALLVCEQKNLASARVIEKNGGVFEDERETEGEILRRYWITL